VPMRRRDDPRAVRESGRDGCRKVGFGSRLPPAAIVRRGDRALAGWNRVGSIRAHYRRVIRLHRGTRASGDTVARAGAREVQQMTIDRFAGLADGVT